MEHLFKNKLEIRNSLSQRILNFIENVPFFPLSTDHDQTFNKLALEVFEWQFSFNHPYRRLCERRGITPGKVNFWTEVPPVTTASLKAMPLFCFDPQEACAIFHTSGTTLKNPGKHYFYSLDIYKTAAMRWFKEACIPQNANYPFLVLGPTAQHFPNSSLGQMFSWILEEFPENNTCTAFTAQGIDFKNAQKFLIENFNLSKPVFILSTSLALLEFVDYLAKLGSGAKLIDGSIVLDTGGYKGRKKNIERDEFLKYVAKNLDIPREMIFNEYGMTEMSSQFYESKFIRKKYNTYKKLAPPWLKSIACDPLTLDILPDGEKGLLRHFDLANLDSVAMVQTEDIGTAGPDGIELFGRPTDALPRGCSLLAEEIIAATKQED